MGSRIATGAFLGGLAGILPVEVYSFSNYIIPGNPVSPEESYRMGIALVVGILAGAGIGATIARYLPVRERHNNSP